MINWNAAATVAAPLASKIFGGGYTPSLQRQQRMAFKETKRTTQMLEKNRYDWLRQGAEKAGFNPASVLGAAGGGAIAQASPLQMASPMNTGAVIADAIYNFADAMDPVRAETERLNNELLQAEINSVKARNQVAASPLGGVPAVQTTQSPVTTNLSLRRTGSAFGFPGKPSTARTALNGPVPFDAVAQGAVDQRVADEGIKNAYGVGGPSWWPTTGYMEEWTGDDSLITNVHKGLNPLVLGAHYLWPEQTEALGHGAKKAFDEWWFEVPTSPQMPLSPAVPSLNGPSGPKPSGGSRIRQKTRRFN